MGCILSKRDGGRNSLVFRVYNVDENGIKHNPGKIEITDTDLILRQKGRDHITWPLRCLRRYGWEEELFSFESGRRCYTGPGIYAFKCRRAETLFRAVQESIMRVGQGDLSSSRAFDNHGHSNSRPPSTIEMSDLMAFSIPNGNTGLSSMREMNYVNQTVVNEHEQHTYQNTAPVRANGSAASTADTAAAALIDFLHNPLQQTDPKLNYIDPDFPTSTESLTNLNLNMNGQSSGARQEQTNIKRQLDSDGRHPSIDIIDCDDTNINEVFDQDSAFESERPAEYINVGPLQDNGRLESKPTIPPPPMIREPEYTNINPKNPAVHQLNYIEVGPGNFSNSKPSTGIVSPSSIVATVPSAPGPSSYAEIDFHRTEALSNRQVLEQDEGSRKTRHNSSISNAF
ncbi:fibroblast growth factor receptor substrate 2-like [Mytilus californianus]|uniref:fibroblast growth factor receptor substrate 2-like n=1 Tax=Mytilus californianus TaxID=6549 RepID=UPI0022476785|nr:fibroblast growth factor receptor substrate 2-like [Mytilus californianus]